MANPEHLKILKQGVEVWNKWREENRLLKPDLSSADLRDTDLKYASLYRTNLRRANLSLANLTGANLALTDLTRAKLCYATLLRANLQSAMLNYANLSHSNLIAVSFSHANLSFANLSDSILSGALLVNTDLSNAKIERAQIYGISVWDIKTEGLIQKDLILTGLGEPEITVDDLEVAQFIYLLLNNQKIRDVIETITSKAVLILGRFTPERNAVLNAIKNELRLRNYLPIVFDFENASNKSIDETVNLLARMSRFVIADITDAKSIPQELRGFVPDNPSIPIVPLILKAQHEYAMFDYFRNFPWVLPLHQYESSEQLIKNIIPVIITPAEQKVLELRMK
ncbi:MAG: pentapeptide repeat-containing protein [Saprospiraceae bacterium]